MTDERESSDGLDVVVEAEGWRVLRAGSRVYFCGPPAADPLFNLGSLVRGGCTLAVALLLGCFGVVFAAARHPELAPPWTRGAGLALLVGGAAIIFRVARGTSRALRERREMHAAPVIRPDTLVADLDAGTLSRGGVTLALLADVRVEFQRSDPGYASVGIVGAGLGLMPGGGRPSYAVNLRRPDRSYALRSGVVPTIPYVVSFGFDEGRARAVFAALADLGLVVIPIDDARRVKRTFF